MSSATPAASRLLVGALRPERRWVAGVVALLVVAMVLPLLGPLLLGWFVDAAVEGRPLHHLTTVAAAYLVTALLGEALQLAVVWASVRLAWRAGNRLREDLAEHALKLDLGWHGRHSAGILIERIDGDVEAMGRFFSAVVLHVLGNVILVAGVLVVSAFIDWRMAVVLGLFAALALLVMVKVRSIATTAYDAEREASAVLLGDLEERLGGLEDLRANGAGPYAVHRLHANASRLWRVSRFAAVRSGGSWALAGSTFSAGSIATLAAGTVLFHRGTLSIGAVLALFRYSQMLRTPLERIAEQLKEFQKAMAGASRAARLLATEPAVVDGPLGPEALPAGALAVEFDGVSFGYEAGVDVLHDVRLRLAPGTHLGVVGRTGSGKTTIGRLLLRFWEVPRDEPGRGTVKLGGVDVRDLQVAALRGRVAVVTQDVELLRASLRDNLTMLGTTSASDDQLEAVLHDVGLGPWFASLEDGLDSVLAGAGSLSAGEAQLLAFARAFLAQPDVVLLDEASSRLDPLTEARIAAASRRLLDGRTAVIIAHRLSTLEEVDEIAVLEGGRVVEHGARSRLAADPRSRYARLRAAAAGGAVVDELEAS